MDDYLIEVMKVVAAQASVRNMTEEEITSMVKTLYTNIKEIGEGSESEPESELVVEPKKAIRDKSILCCICGKSGKMLTKRHLAIHGLTPKEYREKCGYPMTTSLVCKSLSLARSKKMKEMKLWTKKPPANKK